MHFEAGPAEVNAAISVRAVAEAVFGPSRSEARAEFDLLVRRIRGIDAPEQGAWRGSGRWDAPVALAFIVLRGTPVIAAARAVIAAGAVPVLTSEMVDRSKRRHHWGAEGKRHRRARQRAIVEALNDLHFASSGSAAGVSAGFDLRVARPYMVASEHVASAFARIDKMASDFDSAPVATDPAGGRPIKASGIHTVDGIMMELNRWLERRYTDEEGTPGDTGTEWFSWALNSLVQDANIDAFELNPALRERLRPAEPRAIMVDLDEAA